MIPNIAAPGTALSARHTSPSRRSVRCDLFVFIGAQPGTTLLAG
jgi:hypothetical protein